MRTAIFALCAALAASAHAASPTARPYEELQPGRYTVIVSGLLCTVCGRAVASEWSKLPEVESVVVDFDKSHAIVSVRLDKTLKVAALRKTLRKAERLANLGAKYDVREISYRLGK